MDSGRTQVCCEHCNEGSVVVKVIVGPTQCNGLPFGRATALWRPYVSALVVSARTRAVETNELTEALEDSQMQEGAYTQE